MQASGQTRGGVIGVAERWIGSCRRDLLDHVIVMNERHLKRLMTEYVCYYHQDRTHLGLAKDTPAGRPTAVRSTPVGLGPFPDLAGYTIAMRRRRRFAPLRVPEIPDSSSTQDVTFA